jgi:polysaccharide export outer membrane protein
MRNLLGLVSFILTMTVAGLAAAQASYSIRPGDTLQIEVLEDASLNRSVLVLPDGTINFPMVGSLRAAGHSVADVRATLAAGLAPNFANPPNVFVTVAQLAERRPQVAAAAPGLDIYAMGEVAKPGKLEAAPGLTLLQALAQAGGFTRFAATRRIELHRTDPKTGTEQVYLFNYRGGGISGSTPLQEGDVIVVPERRLFE